MASISVNAMEKGDPKAIVILFGWLGSKLKHVQKYASLYSGRGCSTIIGIGPVAATMSYHKPTLETIVDQVVHEAAKLLETSTIEIPIIVHSFSGGGCFLLETLERNIQEERNLDYSKVAAALEGAIYDSCPVYLHIKSGLAGIGRGVNMALVRWVLQGLFLIYVSLNAIFALVLGFSNRPKEHWDHVHHQSMTFWKRQAFIYSVFDTITDSKKIDELIKERKQSGAGIMTISKRFEDSEHVLHYRKYPKEYLAVIDQVLNDVVKSS